jgi:predicted NAD/FAD-dependent oxidoreductase
MQKIEKYDVVIVGAGISGITAGKYLHKNGFSVKILDKGKAIGGRLATRRINFNDEQLQIDYGCKYLEAHTFEFSQELVDLIKNDTVKKWTTSHQNTFLDELENKLKFIGRQSMRQIAIELAKGLNISNNIRVKIISHSNGEWNIKDVSKGLIKAKAVILTMPVPQSLELVNISKIEIPSEIYNNLEKVEYERSIAGILVLENKSNLKNEGGLKFEDGPISFITDNNLKGVNNSLTALTVEMANDFSIENWDKSDDELTELIIEASSEYFNSKVLKSQIHKWRYSTPIKSYPKKFESINLPGTLYFAGDAFLGKNVESAYLSGLYSAKSLYHNYSYELSEIEI